MTKSQKRQNLTHIRECFGATLAGDPSCSATAWCRPLEHRFVVVVLVVVVVVVVAIVKVVVGASLVAGPGDNQISLKIWLKNPVRRNF